MSMFTTLIVLALTFAVINAVISLLIYDFLRRRKEKVSFLLLRFFIPKYVSRYKEITKNETGRTGPLFYGWIGSINLVLLFFVISFLL